MMSHHQPALYPLTFTPELRDYIWGGRNLETLYGRSLPPGPTAESWEISAHPTASTCVDTGPLRGQSLSVVLQHYGADLVGTRASWALAQGKFPLLIKLLDAESRLSVQVHPPDEYALNHEDGELGKTEMWYVLHAQPQARIILGLRSGVTPRAFRQAIAGSQVEEWLHYLPVKVGDAVFIPPGTVHAALEGLVINEVLQNSDTTYRVYDWGRLGADGKPRPLHVDKAMDVIDFQQIEPGPVLPVFVEARAGIVRHRLASCRYFVVEKLSFEAGTTFAAQTNGKTFEIWGAIAGQTQLDWSGGEITLPAIRYCLVPAYVGDFAVRATGAATMLRIYLPPCEDRPCPELAEGGLPPAEQTAW
jgi:mannose-6-phosphate isomerase